MQPTVDADTLGSASKVLVVDDNDDKRYLLSCILEPNFHVIQAENGRKALKMIESDQPDVVFGYHRRLSVILRLLFLLTQFTAPVPGRQGRAGF